MVIGHAGIVDAENVHNSVVLATPDFEGAAEKKLIICAM
jgi:hypothetical protein